MIKIERLTSPEILEEHFTEKTAAFVLNPNRKVFHCRTKLYRQIKERLMLMTDEHCSFCDACPIENTGDAVEHFRPSSTNHALAYVWENLYYICQKCNSAKGNRFHERLLKPDEIEYSFDKYFEYNAREAKLEPTSSDDATDEDRLRAEKTIELYDLNRIGNKKARQSMIKKYVSGRHERNECSYRYIIDLGLI
jgi:uncharacterized protein (TIGR02646 family)